MAAWSRGRKQKTAFSSDSNLTEKYSSSYSTANSPIIWGVTFTRSTQKGMSSTLAVGKSVLSIVITWHIALRVSTGTSPKWWRNFCPRILSPLAPHIERRIPTQLMALRVRQDRYVKLWFVRPTNLYTFYCELRPTTWLAYIRSVAC